MMKKYLLFFLCLLIWNCGPRPPSPTTSAKTDNTYWYGSGVVRIDDNTDYRKTARTRALNKIAEQLEVEINSSIIDMQEAYGVGLSAKVSEYNKVTIESRVNATLKNPEYVDEFKKKGYYHVVARLNKQMYYEKIRKEVAQASTIAMDLINNSEAGPSVISLSNYLKAIKTINPYLDQYPKGSYDGRDEQIYPLLLRLFREDNDRIEIIVKPDKPIIKAIMDENVSLSITVIDKLNNNPIPNIPIAVKWKGQTESFRIVTNENGNATFVLDRHWAVDKNQILSFHLNYDAFMDPEVEPLIDYKTPVKEVNVDVVGPKIFFSYDISNLDEKVADSSLPAAVKKHFINNFSSEFVAKSNFADLELKLIVSTIEKSKRINENYPHMIYANGRIEIVNIATGETILSNNIKTKGGDFNSKEVAGIRAIDNLAKKFGSNDLFSTKKE